jgi:hypothetical protein
MWPAWAGYLHQHRLGGFAAEVSELAGPLAIIGAQLLYLGQPLLRQALPEQHLQALALLLEDQNELKQFACYLREAGSP